MAGWYTRLIGAPDTRDPPGRAAQGILLEQSE